jgi:hypothetical protein
VTTQNALDISSRPDDTRRLEERDILAAAETFKHLAWDLDTVEQVEAALEPMSPRELRAMVVARMLDERFAVHTHVPNPTHDPAPIEAYERFAGHLGLGPVDP